METEICKKDLEYVKKVAKQHYHANNFSKVSYQNKKLYHERKRGQSCLEDYKMQIIG